MPKKLPKAESESKLVPIPDDDLILETFWTAVARYYNDLGLSDGRNNPLVNSVIEAWERFVIENFGGNYPTPPPDPIPCQEFTRYAMKPVVSKLESLSVSITPDSRAAIDIHNWIFAWFAVPLSTGNFINSSEIGKPTSGFQSELKNEVQKFQTKMNKWLDSVPAEVQNCDTENIINEIASMIVNLRSPLPESQGGISSSDWTNLQIDLLNRCKKTINCLSSHPNWVWMFEVLLGHYLTFQKNKVHINESEYPEGKSPIRGNKVWDPTIETPLELHIEKMIEDLRAIRANAKQLRKKVRQFAVTAAKERPKHSTRFKYKTDQTAAYVLVLTKWYGLDKVVAYDKAERLANGREVSPTVETYYSWRKKLPEFWQTVLRTD